jgi:phosphoserine phosphatase
MDELPKIQNISEAVTELKKQGLRAILLTDNPDVLADYFVKFGFERAIGSEAGVEDGYITGELRPLSDKSEGLARFLNEDSLGFDECVHVGDWVNDIPVFRKVGYSIALNARDARVRESASHSMNTESLLDVAEHIARLA